MLARSPGCKAVWLAEFRAACQQVGERPAGVADAAGLFALRLASGPWVVVGMSPQGCDDRGRPGALAFHALFVSPREYRRAGFDPFALAGALRSDWTADCLTLPTSSWILRDEPSQVSIDPRTEAVAVVLARGRRVILEAEEPIDTLARQVWQRLPLRVRRRATVATWAFANGHRFDLLAVPRLAGVTVDASYLDAAALEAAPPEAPRRDRRGWSVSWLLATLAVPIALVPVALALVWWSLARRDDDPARASRLVESAVSNLEGSASGRMPNRADFAVEYGDATLVERRHVAEVLEDLADRCGINLPANVRGDPVAMMEVIAASLRYRGPLLTAAEVARLQTQVGPDAGLVERWQAAMGRFAPDRPLPAHDDLRSGPLRWQLAVLAWSFHVDPLEGPGPAGPRRSPTELAQAFVAALTLDVPLRLPAPLAGDPVLTAYAAFLRRLPRH